MHIVIALPAYNEEQALKPLFDALARDLAGLTCEVVVVDDGSTDRTAEVTMLESHRHPTITAGDGAREEATAVAEPSQARLPITLVRHPRNLGLAAAMRTALKESSARVSKDDWVVTMDADNTHPPSIIRAMPLTGEYNFCVVSRYAPGAVQHGVPEARVGLSGLASRLLRTVFPVAGVRDYSSGYRGYRGDLLKAAFDRYGDALVQSTGFAVQVELVLKMRRVGLVGTEVPIDLHYERKPTPSKARLFHTLIDLAKVCVRDLVGR